MHACGNAVTTAKLNEPSSPCSKLASPESPVTASSTAPQEPEAVHPLCHLSAVDCAGHDAEAGCAADSDGGRATRIPVTRVGGGLGAWGVFERCLGGGVDGLWWRAAVDVSRGRVSVLDGYIDVVAAEFDGDPGLGDAGREAMDSGGHVELPTVPRTGNHTASERTIGQRTAGMRTDPIERMKLAVDVEESDDAITDGEFAAFADGHIAGAGNTNWF